MTFDLIIIGGGPAGYHAARLAGKAGLAVLLAEERPGKGTEPAVGGVCTHEGCIPTKTLLHSARLLDQARRADRYGLNVPQASLDHRKVMERKRKIVTVLERGIVSGLRKQNVRLASGRAVIAGMKGSEFQVALGGEEHTGRRLLIASGSVPFIPPLPGLQEGLASGFIVTSREILEGEDVPASLAVVGAGTVGLEFAYYFSVLGSKVTVIEMLPRIGGTLDSEAALMLQKQLSGQGIEFRLAANVTAFAPGVISYMTSSGSGTVQAERALLCIGRRPMITGMGIESLGVKLDRGGIKTDHQGRTSVEGVYAAGDVTGRALLAHAAYRDAETAVSAMLGETGGLEIEAVPAVIYTRPEAAWAGESEESARTKKIDYAASVTTLRYSGRFLVENEGDDGMCKMIIDKKDGRLIGVHLVGDPASEIAFGASFLIERGASVGDLRRMIFPHPTVSEIFHEAAHML
ncbi:MAG: NAD(P)/FAD-dependent oxidoreductase [Spirochaetales bacterium]|nr:NAD(P)/FAD-dependent oxidoreductase [Spirochaetales bacterium]